MENILYDYVVGCFDHYVCEDFDGYYCETCGTTHYHVFSFYRNDFNEIIKKILESDDVCLDVILDRVEYTNDELRTFKDTLYNVCLFELDKKLNLIPNEYRHLKQVKSKLNEISFIEDYRDDNNYLYWFCNEFKKEDCWTYENSVSIFYNATYKVENSFNNTFEKLRHIFDIHNVKLFVNSINLSSNKEYLFKLLEYFIITEMDVIYTYLFETLDNNINKKRISY